MSLATVTCAQCQLYSPLRPADPVLGRGYGFCTLALPPHVAEARASRSVMADGGCHLGVPKEKTSEV